MVNEAFKTKNVVLVHGAFADGSSWGGVVERLQAAGWRIREAVNDGIRKSRVVLVFISSNSLCSRWVLDELDMAMHREKRERRVVVYPILIGRVSEDSKDFPEDLKGKAYIDLRFRFGQKYRELHRQIITAIREGLGSLCLAADVILFNRLFVAVL